jgi:PAS domain S-box-containing protein
MEDQLVNPKKSSHSRPIQEIAEADAFFLSMGEGAITTDAFGQITRVNPAANHILGYRNNELMGATFLKSIVAISFEGQTLNVIDRPITQAFLTGKPVAGKFYYLNKRGEQVPVAVNVSPIILNNKPVGAIEVFRDITIELEVDRMKSEFISLASHQLRTPLSAIKTYTHMLSDGYMGELNKDQKGSLETIISATNRMNELISTLLNITRIESGTIAVNPKTANLEVLFREVLPELQLLADAKEIAIEMNVKGKASLNIKTDALIVKEVFTNLVSNAIKYTPDKGLISINITPKRNIVQVEVQDNGWGIPIAAQNKVFSKFFRGQNIIKRETSGTGLGLYLVKGLLENLGGKIWFESEEGHGTSFFFNLPRTSERK